VYWYLVFPNPAEAGFVLAKWARAGFDIFLIHHYYCLGKQLTDVIS